MPERESTQFQVRAAFQREFEDKEIIFDEGDQGVLLYVIQSGQVEICRPTEGGGRVRSRSLDRVSFSAR